MTLPVQSDVHIHDRTVEPCLRAFIGAPVYFSAGGLNQLDSEYGAERQLMKQAGNKRQREFYSGRHLARQALQRAGIEPGALLRGHLGNPVWPASTVGSITHDHTVGAAAVCSAADIYSLGIDLIENPGDVTDDLTKLITYPGEIALLRTLYPDSPATGVAFSVKESVVKAVSVYLDRYMDLLEIHLETGANGLVARVDQLARPLPCLVLMTGFGLLTACFSPAAP